MNNCINIEENKKEYFDIYNRKQALFYIRNGAEIEDNDIKYNSKSGFIYFRFKNNDKLQKLFTIWVTRK